MNEDYSKDYGVEKPRNRFDPYPVGRLPEDVDPDAFNAPIRHLKRKVVYSYQLTQKLLSNGCRLAAIDINYNFPDQLVFYFVDTPRSRKILDQWDARKKEMQDRQQL